MNDTSVAIIVIAAITVFYGAGRIGGRLAPKSEEVEEIQRATSGAMATLLVLGLIAIAIIFLLPMVKVPGG